MWGKGIFSHSNTMETQELHTSGYVTVALGHAQQADISFKYRLWEIKQQKGFFSHCTQN